MNPGYLYADPDPTKIRKIITFYNNFAGKLWKFYFTEGSREQFGLQIITSAARDILQAKFFGFVFLTSLERRVDEIKNSKSEIISKLPHLLFAPLLFTISVGHPIVHIEQSILNLNRNVTINSMNPILDRNLSQNNKI